MDSLVTTSSSLSLFLSSLEVCRCIKVLTASYALDGIGRISRVRSLSRHPSLQAVSITHSLSLSFSLPRSQRAALCLASPSPSTPSNATYKHRNETKKKNKVSRMPFENDLVELRTPNFNEKLRFLLNNEVAGWTVGVTHGNDGDRNTHCFAWPTKGEESGVFQELSKLLPSCAHLSLKLVTYGSGCGGGWHNDTAKGVRVTFSMCETRAERKEERKVRFQTTANKRRKVVLKKRDVDASNGVSNRVVLQ